MTANESPPSAARPDRYGRLGDLLRRIASRRSRVKADLEKLGTELDALIDELPEDARLKTTLEDTLVDAAAFGLREIGSRHKDEPDEGGGEK